MMIVVQTGKAPSIKGQATVEKTVSKSVEWEQQNRCNEALCKSWGCQIHNRYDNER